MLQIEAQAKDILAKAQTESAGIVRDARKQAATKHQDALRQAQAKASELLKNGIENARRRREKELERIDAQSQQLRHVPPKKAQAAKQLVFAALAGQ